MYEALQEGARKTIDVLRRVAEKVAPCGNIPFGEERQLFEPLAIDLPMRELIKLVVEIFDVE